MSANTSIQWTERTGRALGSLKAAARRMGISFNDYCARLNAGQLWCTACKAWHERSAFGSDVSRWSGRAAGCLRSRKTGNPRGWSGRPRINAETGRPGPAPYPPRDGDKRQARQRVNVEVRTGRRPHPNELPCVDCGHTWSQGQRRHEYDHYLGYAPEHHLDVESVCTRCHHRRERSRVSKAA